MKKIVIIGGGASGLVASIIAKTEENDVIILERNNTCGKKLLVTGNGKCNYYNENQSISYYNSSDRNILEEIITGENMEKVKAFFKNIGIIPKIKNSYYYPFSNQATTIKNALIREAAKRKVKIHTDCYVTKISKENNKFIVEYNNTSVIADIVLLATGSKAFPKTGSDGNGYLLATNLGHTIIKPLPGLTSLNVNDSITKDWDGVRTDAIVTLLEDEKIIKKESGELQLTKNGLSGICIFNLSSNINRGLLNNKKEEVSINFLPFLDTIEYNKVLEFLQTQNNLVKDINIEELLENILNYKLVKVILSVSKIPSTSNFNNLTDEQKKVLGKNLIDFKLTIKSTKQFDECQVCSGGVSLKEINIKTMESKETENLYFTGELLDVNGDCGGYNLTFAWLSAILAGESIKEK